jgi:hypothetical protein
MAILLLSVIKVADPLSHFRLECFCHLSEEHTPIILNRDIGHIRKSLKPIKFNLHIISGVCSHGVTCCGRLLTNMAASRLWHLYAILGLAMAPAVMAQHSEEDFAFEMTAAEQQEALNGPITQSHPNPASSPVQRLWGIPDTVAPLGKLFHMNVPRDAFTGEVDHYEVSSLTVQPVGEISHWAHQWKDKFETECFIHCSLNQCS